MDTSSSEDSSSDTARICYHIEFPQPVCYIIKSINTPYTYIGYTVDFSRRLRQHNRDISGGAKHTAKYYPFSPVCIIAGCQSNKVALNLEWKLQHLNNHPRKRVYPRVTNILKNLEVVLSKKGGSKTKGESYHWPPLTLYWYIDHTVVHKRVTNLRV